MAQDDTQGYQDVWNDPTAHDGLYPPDWSSRAAYVRRRDDYTCQHCGWSPDQAQPQTADSVPSESGEARELYVRRAVGVEDGGTNAVTNLITVCSSCFTPPAAHPAAVPTPQHAGRQAGAELAYPPWVERLDLFNAFTPVKEISAYQQFLRLVFTLCVLAIVVTMIAQVTLATHHFLVEVTTTYPLAIYSLITVGIAGISFGVPWSIQKMNAAEQFTPPTLYRSLVKLGLAIGSAGLGSWLLVTALSTTLTLPVPHVVGLGGQAALGLGTWIGIGIVSLGVSLGSFHARFHYDYSIHPTLWMSASLMPIGWYAWTWLFLRQPYHPQATVTLVVPHSLTTIGEAIPHSVPRGPVLFGLSVLPLLVGVGYLARITFGSPQSPAAGSTPTSTATDSDSGNDKT